MQARGWRQRKEPAMGANVVMHFGEERIPVQLSDLADWLVDG